MMYWDGDWSGWGWFAMTLSMVLFWTAVGVVIWLVVRRPSGAGRGLSAPSAEEVLRQRFAAGDIDQVEFERRADALRHAGRAPTNMRS